MRASVLLCERERERERESVITVPCVHARVSRWYRRSERETERKGKERSMEGEEKRKKRKKGRKKNNKEKKTARVGFVIAPRRPINFDRSIARYNYNIYINLYIIYACD